MNENDRILDMARALGRAIQLDGRYVAMKEARESNDNNEKLQELIGRFNLVKMNLNSEIGKTDRDEKKVETLNSELVDVYNDIMSDTGMVLYQSISEELNTLVAYINAIISGSVNGENPDEIEPSDCSGDCGSCGGCH